VVPLRVVKMAALQTVRLFLPISMLFDSMI
jgi:hypothetical protein